MASATRALCLIFLAAIALASTGLAAATPVLASSALGGGPALRVRSAQVTASRFSLPNNDSLYGISAVSPSSALVVGLEHVTVTGHELNMAGRWNGRFWKLVSVPQPSGTSADNEMAAVSELSPTSAWAVGQALYHPGQKWKPQILHWNGRAWRLKASPDPGSAQGRTFLNAVVAIGPMSAWTAGAYEDGAGFSQTLIEHWNGKSWRQVTSPDPAFSTQPNVLYGLAASSASDIWAVGYLGHGSVSRTLILHWNGRAWRHVASPSPRGSRDSEFNAVTAISRSNAWAVGFYNNGSADQTLIEHWNGKSWKIVSSPDPGGASMPNELFGVTGVTRSSVWAVGDVLVGTGLQTVMLRWSGKSWRAVSQPTPSGATAGELRSVFALSASDAWAVGWYGKGTDASYNLIERWNGRKWRIVANPSP